MYAIGYPLFSVATLLDYLLLIYSFVLIAVVILSWTNPDPLNPLVRILRNLTEPVMERVRRFVPLVGGIDLTPLVILAGIFFIRTGVLRVITRWATEISN